MKIGVIGAGYVGLVAGVGFADAGHDVFCADSNSEKLKSLEDGKIPFYEPGLQDLFSLNRKRLNFTSSIATLADKCPIIFIAINTPEKGDGQMDLSATFDVLKEICLHSHEEKVVVLKSTVPVGTFRQAQSLIGDFAKCPIHVVNNPEFLRQGAAVEDFQNPDRIVLGLNSDYAKEQMLALYRPFADRNDAPILCMDNASAEMAKFAANSFLALKISFINELALLADELGADIDSIREGFTSDHRINPLFFAPGIGYGGSCFPKDIRALIHTGKTSGLDMKILKAVEEVNERQKKILIEKILRRFGSLRDLKIGLLGLSFKPRTDDLRRAPSLEVISELQTRGAFVKAYDPVAARNMQKILKSSLEICDSAEAASKDVDALLILTEWPEFQALDLQLLKENMKRPIIFDGRNIFDPQRMLNLGFEYFGIGKQPRVSL